MQENTASILHPRELSLVFGSGVHEFSDCVGEIIVDIKGGTHHDRGFVGIVIEGVAADFLAFLCDLWTLRFRRLGKEEKRVKTYTTYV